MSTSTEIVTTEAMARRASRGVFQASNGNYLINYNERPHLYSTQIDEYDDNSTDPISVCCFHFDIDATPTTGLLNLSDWRSQCFNKIGARRIYDDRLRKVLEVACVLGSLYGLVVNRDIRNRGNNYLLEMQGRHIGSDTARAIMLLGSISEFELEQVARRAREHGGTERLVYTATTLANRLNDMTPWLESAARVWDLHMRTTVLRHSLSESGFVSSDREHISRTFNEEAKRIIDETITRLYSGPIVAALPPEPKSFVPRLRRRKMDL